ncbi:MAG TPA: hypothetical protein VF482_09315 [Trebonia sp.]
MNAFSDVSGSGSSGSIDEFYPNLAPLLATPCDFIIYSKNIRA